MHEAGRAAAAAMAGGRRPRWGVTVVDFEAKLIETGDLGLEYSRRLVLDGNGHLDGMQRSIRDGLPAGIGYILTNQQSRACGRTAEPLGRGGVRTDAIRSWGLRPSTG